MLASRSTTAIGSATVGRCRAATTAGASRVHHRSINRYQLVSASSSSAADTLAPTNGNGAAPTLEHTPTQSLPASAVAATKLQLLEEVAALDRGALATGAQHERVAALVATLEASAAGAPAPLSGSPAPAEGRWQMLYTNKQVFRGSPFFAAFKDGLVQDANLAEAIFEFTDAIPGAEIGSALQTLSLASCSLISEVDMAVFPGLRGTVVTSARAAVLAPTRLALDVQSTRVANSVLGPLLDSVSVPVEQLIEAVRGAGATRVIYEITYVDEGLRVTRCGDQLMVHRRL